MTGPALAAVLLAAAVLAAPSPRRHLAQPKSRPRITRAAAPVVAVPLLAAAAVAAPAVAVAGVLVSAVSVRRWGRSRRRAQRRAQGRAMASALQSLVGELSVGAHPVQAFGAAAADCDGAVAAALRGVAARARLGSDVATGLREAGSASEVPAYWSRVEVCWALAAQRGLPMSVLMRAAQRDIVERQRFTDRVDAGLAGARATAAILAGLPVLGILLGHLVGAHPLRFLIGGGGWVLVTGVALLCAGVGWSDRIIDRLAP